MLVLLRGEQGLDVWALDDEPGRTPWVRSVFSNRRRRWRMPEPQTRILILSDLGLVEFGSTASKGWEQFGQQCRAAGCDPMVLCPVPAEHLSARLQRYSRLIAWDRDSRLRPVAGGSSGSTAAPNHDTAERLLSLVAPAIVIDSTLLRAARYLLHAAESDVAAEALAWAHADVASCTQGITFANRTAVDKYQSRFGKLPIELRKRFAILLRDHHAHLPASVRYAELDACERLAPGSLSDELRNEVERWRADVVATCEQYPDSVSLAEWRQRQIDRSGERVWSDNPQLAALWAQSQRAALAEGEPLELPAGVNLEDISYFFV
jgi:hypothetical protein